MQGAECFDLPCLPVASFVLFTAQRGQSRHLRSISSLLVPTTFPSSVHPTKPSYQPLCHPLCQPTYQPPWITGQPVCNQIYGKHLGNHLVYTLPSTLPNTLQSALPTNLPNMLPSTIPTSKQCYSVYCAIISLAAGLHGALDREESKAWSVGQRKEFSFTAATTSPPLVSRVPE